MDGCGCYIVDVRPASRRDIITQVRCGDLKCVGRGGVCGFSEIRGSKREGWLMLPLVGSCYDRREELEEGCFGFGAYIFDTCRYSPLANSYIIEIYHFLPTRNSLRSGFH